MSEYEGIINLYERLHSDYGWTRGEADLHSVEWIMDLIIVKAKLADPPKEKFKLESVF